MDKLSKGDMLYMNYSIITDGLSYEFVKKIAKNSDEIKYFTKEGWKGIHFYDGVGRHCILTENLNVVTDVPSKFITGQSERVWMLITPNEIALGIINEYLI